MLRDLFQLHHEIMGATDQKFRRALYDKVNWDAQAICIYGARGVGKTTMLCQHLLNTYESVQKALYISADNIHVLTGGLLALATEYFSMGGEALYIDEVHKYPNWSIEVKNIIDSYRTKKLVISGSSAMDLHQGKGDLSRRVVYYELPGLSFREYLIVSQVVSVPAISLEHLLKNHVDVAKSLGGITILKHFHDYLNHGYYPYFLDQRDLYLTKLNQVIEKVITEDIALSKNLKATTVIILKKILWLIATAKCLSPNMDSMSRDLHVTRETVYSAFDYMEQAGIILNIYPHAKGAGLIRKPGKTYLNNTNLMHAIHGTLALQEDIGAVRETFFANQVSVEYALHTHEKADFTLDQQYVIEVGGRNKTRKQLQGNENGILALDGIEIGFGRDIPLYLFGFLY